MTGIARITAAFDQAAADNRAALMPFLTGGYPDRETFLRDARVLLEHADLLEVGLPYSDPLGDGPTIQAAGQAALTAGATTAGVLEDRKSTRLNSSHVAISYAVFCLKKKKNTR